MDSSRVREGLLDVDVDEIVIELYDAPQAKRTSFESTIEARVVHAKFHGLKVRFYDTGMDTRLNWRAFYTGWYVKRALQRQLKKSCE